MQPTPQHLLAAWRIWKAEVVAGKPTHQSVTQIATVIAGAMAESVEDGQWCAACGKFTDHKSGTCPTITH